MNMDEKHLDLLKNEKDNFSALLGIKLTRVEPGYAEGVLAVGPQHYNPRDTIHGGCLFSLMDTVGGAAAFAYGSPVTTSGASIEFLRAARNTKTLRATATQLKAGRTLVIMEIVVEDDTGTLLTKATMTFFRLQSPK